MLEAHCTRLALALALASAGKSSAARMAMMAMTTRSSIKVKPGFLQRALKTFEVEFIFVLGLMKQAPRCVQSSSHQIECVTLFAESTFHSFLYVTRSTCPSSNPTLAPPLCTVGRP